MRIKQMDRAIIESWNVIYRWCYHGDNDNNSNDVIEIPNDLIIMIIMCSNSDNDNNNYDSEGINK